MGWSAGDQPYGSAMWGGKKSGLLESEESKRGYHKLMFAHVRRAQHCVRCTF